MKKIIIVLMFFGVACSDSNPAVSPGTVPSTDIQCRERAACCQRPLLGATLPDMRIDAYYQGKFQKIHLKNYSDKWLILFFYPSDFTFVCPTELKELSDYYQEFTALDTEIISISTDSVYVHRAWKKDNENLKNIRYPMASDRSGSLSRQMGVYNPEQGLAERATFLVSPEGRIVAYEFHHESIGRSADELLRKLAAAQAVRSGTGGYCPAGWKPGEEVIHAE